MPSANKTSSLGLNQWVGNEHVKRQDFYDDNTKIDRAIGEIQSKVNNMALVDSKIQITDNKDKFYGTSLDKVLDEVDDKIIVANNTANNARDKANENERKLNSLEVQVGSISLTASRITYDDSSSQMSVTNVQQAIEKLATEVVGVTNQLKSANDTLETIIG